MKAGRELDALVAEKVMGWELSKHNRWRMNGNPTGYMQFPPHQAWEMCENKYFNPSTRISDAWQVLGMFKDARLERNEELSPKYTVDIWANGKKHRAFADTAELAICLAALKAVGVEVDC